MRKIVFFLMVAITMAIEIFIAFLIFGFFNSILGLFGISIIFPWKVFAATLIFVCVLIPFIRIYIIK